MRNKVIVLLLIFELVGCAPISDEREVYGDYELRSGGTKIALRVAQDHSFSESITFPNGQEQRNSGRWEWQQGAVGHACINGLLIPKALMTYLSGNWQPKAVGESYQYDDCLAAGKEYGRTILEINPDGENFVKVGSTK